MSSHEEREYGYSKRELLQSARLRRALKKLDRRDTASLALVIKATKTKALMGVFEEYDAGRELHDGLGVETFSVYDKKVHRAVRAELRARGLVYEPDRRGEWLPGKWREAQPLTGNKQ